MKQSKGNLCTIFQELSFLSLAQLITSTMQAVLTLNNHFSYVVRFIMKSSWMLVNLGGPSFSDMRALHLL